MINNLRTSSSWLSWFAAMLLLLATAGCGPTPMAVEGRVTLDGVSLDEAAVLFVPLDAERKKTGCSIRAGQFSLAAADGLLPGRYRVEIIDNPPLQSGHQGNSARSRRRPFPYRYANQSPLEVEIDDSSAKPGPLRLDFALSSDSLVD